LYAKKFTVSNNLYFVKREMIELIVQKVRIEKIQQKGTRAVID